MLKFAFLIALRFLNSKGYGSLARFISIASKAGIGIGVAALIIGLSAMNGFEYELKNRVLSLVPGAQVHSLDNKGFINPDESIKLIKKHPEVEAVAPVVSIHGAFNHENSFAPALILGIDTTLEKEVIEIENFMTDSIENLDKENTVILGASIADKLGIKIGDKVNLSISETKSEQSLGQLKSHTLTLVGLFRTGGQIDGNFAFINLKDALRLTGQNTANTVHIKVSNMLEANRILHEAVLPLEDYSSYQSWIDSQGKLYHDIQMVRGIMYLAMILVITVACFNIISTLIMAVTEKRSEIAILLTMGIKRKAVVLSFTLMGILSAVKGCISGTVLGGLIALVLPFATAHFKDVFGFDLLNADIYFINFIPSRLELFDIILVDGLAILISLIASIYPALKAAKIKPAMELNL